MEFFKDSEKIIRILMVNFSQFYKNKSSTERKIYDDILKDIYDKLVLAQIKMEEIWNSRFLYKNIKEKVEINELKIEDGVFFQIKYKNILKIIY